MEMSSPGLEADCAQNIALLYYLGRIASRPHKNLIRHQGANADRTISLDDEKHLTSTLGLLSSIRDDISNVTAVCVEEKQHGVVIMVAANAAEPGLSSPFLPSVKLGFDKVFSLLKDASFSTREQLGCDVLGAIVSMCRWRILQRIRMVQTAGKPPFERFLGEINDGMSLLPRNPRKRRLIVLSKQLMSKLAEYRNAFKHPGNHSWTLAPDEALVSIIQTCYEISKMPNIDNMLLNDTSRTRPRLEPSSCEAVVNMVRKVASYKRAALALVKLARRYESIRHASTLIVTLDSAAFAQSIPVQRPGLCQVLAKLKAHHGTSWKANRTAEKLSRHLGSESEHYQSRINVLTSHPKVHAEMQLIWHLDQHKGPTPPRVIASNKDACYLCNAFIAFHGKYSIPKTHGRIYPGWRLPSSGMRKVREGFSRELERLAVDRIRVILERGVERIDCPLESTVPSAAVSGLSILTQHAQVPEETADSSDSDETVVPEHGAGDLGQQTEEFVSQQQGDSTGNDGSGTEEAATPSCNGGEAMAEPRLSLIQELDPGPPEVPGRSHSEVEAVMEPSPSSIQEPEEHTDQDVTDREEVVHISDGEVEDVAKLKPLPVEPPEEDVEQGDRDREEVTPLRCNGVEAIIEPRPSSPGEPHSESLEERADDDKSCLQKTKPPPSPRRSSTGSGTDSSSSVGSQLKQIATYETRPSSASMVAADTSDKKPDVWRKVEEGRREEAVRLSSSLELFVEYTCAPPSKSKYLRFKARRLSEEEVAVLKKDDRVYDLKSLGDEAVCVESSSRGGIRMRVDHQVFVVHLDKFVAPR